MLPPEAVHIDPKDFDGVDPCLRDTSGPVNKCARRWGVIRSPGGEPERPCVLTKGALESLKRVRKRMKEQNPNLEIMVISSYRPPGHQQCLWAKRNPDGEGYQCNGAVCGPRDPKTRKRMPCRRYDLTNPRYAHIFDNCPHVNLQTIDVSAYDKTQAPINERNQMDMTIIEDCRRFKKVGRKIPKGHIYHPSCCRFTNWTSDFRAGSARARKIFGDGPVDAQLIMIKALRKEGWVDTVPQEWWHFTYRGK